MFATTIKKIKQEERSKGRKGGEKHRQIEIAKKMARKRMSLELISEMSEFSILEFQEILKWEIAFLSTPLNKHISSADSMAHAIL